MMGLDKLSAGILWGGTSAGLELQLILEGSCNIFMLERGKNTQS